MSRKDKTGGLVGSSSGHYLSLAVAAHLARSQLVSNPLKVYDAQHLSDMLNARGTVWIARHSPQGHIARLAMQLMSALHETRSLDETPGGFRLALARLRAALQERTFNSNE